MYCVELKNLRRNTNNSYLLKICDHLSILVKVYSNKNEYCSEIKYLIQQKYT